MSTQCTCCTAISFLVLDRLRKGSAHSWEAWQYSAHVREQEITTGQLSKEIGVAPIDVRIGRCQLRCFGHVARMPPERYACRVLSSWIGRALLSARLAWRDFGSVIGVGVIGR